MMRRTVHVAGLCGLLSGLSIPLGWTQETPFQCRPLTCSTLTPTASIDDATTDDSWIYQLARQGNHRRSRVINSNVRTAILKYGARVEIQMLTRESKKDFGSFELEAVPGMFLYQYLISQQDTNVYIMTEYVVKLPRSTKI